MSEGQLEMLADRLSRVAASGYGGVVIRIEKGQVKLVQWFVSEGVADPPQRGALDALDVIANLPAMSRR
jgi:hypothetical protein